MVESFPLWPASWPVWIRKCLPYAERFRDAWTCHDWLYTFGGTEFERWIADIEFFELMIEDCDNLFQAFFAFAYFALVRIFGWAFFRYFETCGKATKRYHLES